MSSNVPGDGASAAARDAPAVSVVMPVHNARPYLDESVGSILGQTLQDFELVILDDASTDGTAEALRRWAAADARIRLFESPGKLGLSGSSNFVVRRARAPLVARMDADDIAHPERLARQREVFLRSPEVVLVGALCVGIDSRGRRVRPRDRWRLARPSLFPPFPHSSVMFRRRAFEEAGGYREECAHWEDQDLFLRMTRRGRVVVLPEALVRYRYHASNSTGVAPDHNARVYSLRARCLEEFRAGRDYAPLLASCSLNGSSPVARAEALYQAGAMRLWAGRAPEILGPVLSGGPLGRSPRALLTYLMAVWGAASPASLRHALRYFIRARDVLAGRRVKDGGRYDWRLE
ncbi:MAG TPA: glycosyltransferase family A protein [Pyrinomonadaceae bacterium]|nr:glycosyltransferase family A protein [Pyrinomonadaceae bacterium]